MQSSAPARASRDATAIVGQDLNAVKKNDNTEWIPNLREASFCGCGRRLHLHPANFVFIHYRELFKAHIQSYPIYVNLTSPAFKKIGMAAAE